MKVVDYTETLPYSTRGPRLTVLYYEHESLAQIGSANISEEGSWGGRRAGATLALSTLKGANILRGGHPWGKKKKKLEEYFV